MIANHLLFAPRNLAIPTDRIHQGVEAITAGVARAVIARIALGEVVVGPDDRHGAHLGGIQRQSLLVPRLLSAPC